jgi:hypothetical protein
VALGVDPGRLMVRDGNEGAEGRGGEQRWYWQRLWCRS